jgi:hypothetical protein
MAALGPRHAGEEDAERDHQGHGGCDRGFRPVRRPGADRSADHDQHGARARQPEVSDELVPTCTAKAREHQRGEPAERGKCRYLGVFHDLAREREQRRYYESCPERTERSDLRPHRAERASHATKRGPGGPLNRAGALTGAAGATTPVVYSFMNRAPDVEQLLRNLMDRAKAGDGVAELFAPGAGTLLVGSEPDDWYPGSEPAVLHLRDSLEKYAEIPFEPDAPVAWSEGSGRRRCGWLADSAGTFFVWRARRAPSQRLTPFSTAWHPCGVGRPSHVMSVVRRRWFDVSRA